MSPPPIVHSCVWLVPQSSCTSGEEASSAFSGSTTTGSGSYSTNTCSAASRTPYLSVPSTIATAWPTYLTSPLASGQCSADLISTPGGTHAIGIGESSWTSSAVKTPKTPGADRADSPSIVTIFACASVERTIAMWSMPDSTMSSTYWPRPVIIRGSSLRRSAWPTHLVSGVACSTVLMPAPPSRRRRAPT